MADPTGATLLADRQGVVRMASSAAARLLDCAPSDLEGCRLEELLESPARVVLETALSSVAGSGLDTPTRVAARLRMSGGRAVEADLLLTPVAASSSGAVLIEIRLLDASRAPSGTTATAGALDPEIMAQAASADAVAICRDEVVIEDVEGLATLAGLAPRRVEGLSIKDIIASEDLLPAVERLRQVQSGARPLADFGFRLMKPRGETVEVTARARRIHHRGEPAVLLGLQDISEPLRVARRAARSAGQLDAALAATGDAVLVLGPAARGWPVLLASRSLDQLFGVDGARFLGRPFRDIWSHMRAAHARPEEEGALMEALLEDAGAVRVDAVRLAGPLVRILERTLGPLKDASGSVTGSVVVFRDVTERIEAEQSALRAAREAERAHEELAGLHEELRLANEGLERRLAQIQTLNRDLRVLDEMKSNLLANVSHELQTPLVSIKGFTEMIMKGSLGEVNAEQERGLRVALRNINRLIGLIEGLLAFARSGEPASPLRLRAFPLGPLVEEALALVAETARRKGIALRTGVPSGDLVLMADRDMILQVLLNLTANAIKYNRDGGLVAIEASRGRGGLARIQVSDTGLGIPPDEMERIFERGYRASNAPDSEVGSGLGLTLCRDILRRHGCTIRAESEEGIGATFTFTVPMERASREDEPTGRSSHEAADLSPDEEPAPEASPAERSPRSGRADA